MDLNRDCEVNCEVSCIHAHDSCIEGERDIEHDGVIQSKKIRQRRSMKLETLVVFIVLSLPVRAASLPRQKKEKILFCFLYMLRSIASSTGASTHLTRTHHSLHRLVTPRSRSLTLTPARRISATSLIRPTAKAQSFRPHHLSSPARSLFKRSFASPVSRCVP